MTNFRAKATNSIAKATNLIAKVTNSIAKVTNSIAKTCKISFVYHADYDGIMIKCEGVTKGLRIFRIYWLLISIKLT